MLAFVSGEAEARQETRLTALLGAACTGKPHWSNGAGWGFTADPGTAQAETAQGSFTLAAQPGLGVLSQTNLGICTNWIHQKTLDKIPNGIIYIYK